MKGVMGERRENERGEREDRERRTYPSRRDAGEVAACYENLSCSKPKVLSIENLFGVAVRVSLELIPSHPSHRSWKEREKPRSVKLVHDRDEPQARKD